MSRVLRVLVAAALLTALGAGLVACGKKAPPVPPAGSEGRFPRTYPQPEP